MTALMGLTTVVALARLQVIVSPTRDGHEHLGGLVDALSAEGVDLIQVRPSSGPDQTELDQAFNQARARALPRHCVLAVGHDVEWARRVQADVLHLGAGDAPSSVGRAAVAPYGLVGRSVHTEEQLRAALEDPDLAYLNVGPVFGDQAAGLDLIRLAASLAPPQQVGSRTWFAVGGITRDRLPEVIEAGAMRIGVGSAITGAPEPAAAAADLVELMRLTWETTPGMDRVRFAAFRLGNRAEG